MVHMRILIYGAGVIGSLYAAVFAEAGCQWKTVWKWRPRYWQGSCRKIGI